MYISAFVFFVLNMLPAVHAALYVISPTTKSICHGGRPCTVQWLDDGISPLLDSIGACTVALYTGNQQIVQQIEPVDVSGTHSFTFVPDPKAGPDSNAYYIGFTSAAFQLNGTSPYTSFSSPFTLDRMQGSFSSPLPSATSPIPIPATVSRAPPNTVASTVTVGALPTRTTAPRSSSPTRRPTTASPTSTPSPSFVTQVAPTTTSTVPGTTLSLPPSSASTVSATTAASSPANEPNTSGAQRLARSVPMAGMMGVMPLFLALAVF